jgi:hypothetical protein
MCWHHGLRLLGGIRIIMDLIILSCELSLHFYASVIILSDRLE